MKCTACGNDNAENAQFCGGCGAQVSTGSTPPSPTRYRPGPTDSAGVELASIPRRLAARCLDSLIIVFTLYIGWLIWSFIVYGRGKSPGKQLVGIYAARVDNPEHPLSWGSMFLREFVIKGLLFGLVLNVATSAIVWVLDYLWALWDGSGYSQTLHDKVVKSSVYRVQQGA